MTEGAGHFESGRWVEERTIAMGIDERLYAAIHAVHDSLETTAGVACDLVTTDEGRQYRQKVLAETETNFRHSLDTVVTIAKIGMTRKIRG